MSALVKTAIGSLADTTEMLRFSVDAIEHTVGPTPADAEPTELRRAAHSCHHAAVQIVWLALEVAKVGGVLQTVASVKESDGG